MGGAEVKPASGVQRLMVSGLEFEALIADIAGEVLGGQLEVTEELIAAAGVERIILLIMLNIKDDGAHVGAGQALLCLHSSRRRVEDLVTISQGGIALN